MAKIDNARSSLESLQREPKYVDEDPGASRGRPFNFDPAWYPELIKGISEHNDLPGFGSLMVQTFACEITRKKMEFMATGDGGGWRCAILHSFRALVPVVSEGKAWICCSPNDRA